MFLSLLKGDQKQLFLSMAYGLAILDGDFSENESIAINSYSAELGIDFKLDNIDNDLNHVISEMKELCGYREKKIIIFEIIGLAMSDYNYDKKEREFIGKVLKEFNLEKEFGIFCEEKLMEYFRLQEELNKKILL